MAPLSFVIPGLDPGISGRPGDGRVKSGHDEVLLEDRH